VSSHIVLNDWVEWRSYSKLISDDVFEATLIYSSLYRDMINDYCCQCLVLLYMCV
jgi:hypothetical protein